MCVCVCVCIKPICRCFRVSSVERNNDVVSERHVSSCTTTGYDETPPNHRLPLRPLCKGRRARSPLYLKLGTGTAVQQFGTPPSPSQPNLVPTPQKVSRQSATRRRLGTVGVVVAPAFGFDAPLPPAAPPPNGAAFAFPSSASCARSRQCATALKFAETQRAKRGGRRERNVIIIEKRIE